MNSLKVRRQLHRCSCKWREIQMDSLLEQLFEIINKWNANKKYFSANKKSSNLESFHNFLNIWTLSDKKKARQLRTVTCGGCHKYSRTWSFYICWVIHGSEHNRGIAVQISAWGIRPESMWKLQLSRSHRKLFEFYCPIFRVKVSPV